MIADVRIKPLRELVDPNGRLQHMVRADDELFAGFGEVYFSFTNPGVVKGWHQQSEQTNLLSCVTGELRLVLFDARPGSPTLRALDELSFGEGDRKVVRVPPGVIYGWKNVGRSVSILANCSDRPHQAGSGRKIALDSGEVPFVW